MRTRLRQFKLQDHGVAQLLLCREFPFVADLSPLAVRQEEKMIINDDSQCRLVEERIIRAEYLEINNASLVIVQVQAHHAWRIHAILNTDQITVVKIQSVDTQQRDVGRRRYRAQLFRLRVDGEQTAAVVSHEQPFLVRRKSQTLR